MTPAETRWPSVVTTYGLELAAFDGLVSAPKHTRVMMPDAPEV